MAIVILFGPLFGLPAGTIPLIAIQLLYVNLATDGLPAIALSIDPPDIDVMRQKPRPRKQTIFTMPVIRYMAGVGIWTTIVTLAVFLWAVDSGKSILEAQGVCFLTLILIEFFNALNCRSLEYSFFRIGPLGNKWLIWAILGTVAITAPIFYVPFLKETFHVHVLTSVDWIVSVLSASTIFIGAEIYKLIIHRTRTKGLFSKDAA
jgi:Ca2+-transporting ATPase